MVDASDDGSIEAGVESGTCGDGGTKPIDPCTDGDCREALKTRSGKAMDGWANIDPPAQAQPPDGIEGNGQYDNMNSSIGTTGTPCSYEPLARLPFKRAHWQLIGSDVAACTTYKVTIRFTGVVECRTYASSACTRAASQGRDAKYDLWCAGAKDDPQVDLVQHNRYLLSVTPAVSADRPVADPDATAPPGEWWALNECPEGESESPKTWMIDFEKTIAVPAGWWINFLEFSSRCREILNCGTSNDSAASCTTHYMLAPQSPIPAPPLSIVSQPAAAGAGQYGQWVYFDVKSIVPTGP
jgi:hypothetical protein